MFTRLLAIAVPEVCLAIGALIHGHGWAKPLMASEISVLIDAGEPLGA